MGDRLGIHGAVGSFCRGAGTREWMKPTLAQLGSDLDWACPNFLGALANFTPFLGRQKFPTPGVEPGPSG